MFISIIIPTYNSIDSLKEMIGSLYKQSHPADQYEIIVVDDGSSDGTGAWVESQKKGCPCHLKYLFQKNQGPASARNLGLKNARGEIVAFTDSDDIASSVWIEEIGKGYDDDRVAGIGGTIKAKPTSSAISQYCAYIRFNEQPPVDKTGIIYLITGNASFRKSSLNSIGGFDERYSFAGGEDVDLSFRLKKRGFYFKYNKTAIIFSHHKETLAALLKAYFNYGKGDSFLTLDNFPSLDLVSVSCSKWALRFLDIFTEIFRIFIKNIRLFLHFIKIPSRTLLYYGEGKEIATAFKFASLDFLKQLSFIWGLTTAYILGLPKGYLRKAASKDTSLR